MKKLLVFLLLLAACSSDAPAESPAPELMEAVGFSGTAPDYVTVTRGTVEQLAARHGLVRVDSVPLEFRVSGRLETVYIEMGDTVYEGQLLARLYTGDLERQIQQTENSIAEMITNNQLEADIFALQTALRHLDYAEAIRTAATSFDPEIIQAAENIILEIEQSELAHKHAAELRELDINHARYRLAALNQRLAGRRLYAPSDGMITFINMITATFYFASDLDVFIEDVSIAMSITLRRVQRVQAHINGIVYELDIIPRTMQELVLAHQMEEPVRWYSWASDCGTPPPMGAYATLVYSLVFVENVLRVPPNTVMTTPDLASAVYRLSEAGELGLTVIQTGAVTDTYIEVLEGLEEGDVVLVR